jgi:2-polyprenyl-3-methyl-5-hydroxy-6-metoxy-1,4-benzoquinol methylase
MALAAFPLLDERHRQPEWMDEADLDPQLHNAALRGLERLNWLSRTVAAVWHPLNRLAEQRGLTRLSVLDIACGAGDLLTGLTKRARRAGIELAADGCDVSVTALEHARRRAAAEHLDTIGFIQCDVMIEPLPGSYDVVISSLFLHHLGNEQAAMLLRKASDAARMMLIVTDLERSRRGYALTWLATRVFTTSPVVRVDGIRSIRAAFTRREIQTIASRAGLPPATITTHWPCRWRLVIEHQCERRQ